MRLLKIISIVFFYIGSIVLAGGAVFDGGDIINVTKPVKDDLYITGDEINIQAKITGDLVGYGRRIYLNDTVTGDVIIFADQVILNGIVQDDIRIAGRGIRISNDIKGDLIVFAGELTIDKDVIIHGDLIVNGGKILLEGTVKGNVRLRSEFCTIKGGIKKNLDAFANRSLIIDGSVKGKSRIASHNLILHPDKTRFYDNVDYWSKDDNLNFSGMMITGMASYNQELKIKKWDWRYFGLHPAGFFLGLILAGFICILFFHFLFSKILFNASSHFRMESMKSLGVGVLYFLGLPIAIFLLIIMIIGIPLGVFLLFLYLASILFGMVITSIMVSNYILLVKELKWKFWKVSWISLVVLIVLNLLLLIPLIGFLIIIFLTMVSYGAILIELIKSYKHRKIQIITT